MSGILFLITARGGSKGVPGKNMETISDLSLIGWKARNARRAIEHLKQSEWRPNVIDLVISTDDPAMAHEAVRHGVKVPFMRPDDLATDTSTSEAVVRHALNELGGKHSTVFLLEPSSPFATAYDLIEAYGKFCSLNADLVVGMRETTPHTHFIVDRLKSESIVPLILRMKYPPRPKHVMEGDKLVEDRSRQAFEPQWTMNGALYIFKADLVRQGGSIYDGTGYGYLMNHWHSIEIDRPEDLEMARYAVSAGHVAVPKPFTIGEKLSNLLP